GQSVLEYAALLNPSPLTVTVKSISLQGADFSLGANGCPTIYQPFSGCANLEIFFKPTRTGLRTGTLTVVADDFSQPHVITLQGTGVSGGQATLSSNSISFATRAVGTQSIPKNLQITNTGTGPLSISSIATSPAFFSETTNCGAILAAG